MQIKVRKVGLMKAAFKATTTLARESPGLVPTRPLMGQRLLRAVKLSHYQKSLRESSSGLTRRIAEDVRRIRDGKEDWNRWSGSGMNELPDHGALNTCLHSTTVLAEFRDATLWPEEGATHLLCRLRPVGIPDLVDLSDSYHAIGGSSPIKPSDTFYASLFDQLNPELPPQKVDPILRLERENGSHPTASPELLSRKASAVKEAALAPDDHSCGRGIGLALAELGYRGIIAASARPTDPLNRVADVVALFGNNGQPHPHVEVEGIYRYTPSSGWTLVGYAV